MKKITLGRTGIATTAAGLGAGGFSRLGLEKHGEDHAAGIVRRAFDLGVRFFDTAAVYGTETAVGNGLRDFARDSYVISTKLPLKDNWRENPARRFTETLDASLRALNMDYIDIYNLHGVLPEDYADARDLLVPEMIKAKKAGKIQFLGITEAFEDDTAHKMLDTALEDDIFDVIMVGYNMMNPSAAKTVFPRAIRNNIGVLCMFAVRQALHDPAKMKTDIIKILQNNQGGPGLEADERALDFLTGPDKSGAPAAASIMDAAYRFCAHNDGVHVVLTGTGSPAHLEDNLRSIDSGALPPDILERLDRLFGLSDCVCGQEKNWW